MPPLTIIDRIANINVMGVFFVSVKLFTLLTNIIHSNSFRTWLNFVYSESRLSHECSRFPPKVPCGHVRRFFSSMKSNAHAMGGVRKRWQCQKNAAASHKSLAVPELGGTGVDFARNPWQCQSWVAQGQFLPEIPGSARPGWHAGRFRRSRANPRSE